MYQTMPDTRVVAILNWLNHLGYEISSFEPASNDASFRRYFRITHAGGRHIIMDAPPDKENTKPFIRIAGLFRQANIHVPAIYQQNLDEGFLLLEDFGSQCLLDLLTPENADALYQTAFDSLFNLQSRSGLDTTHLPEYDAKLLRRELDIFYQWFLGKLLQMELPETLRDALDRVLIDAALQQPRVSVHRDFHSRNLMVLKQQSPGVIDFQDAVIGPVTYDLVSLLRDCYISWPELDVYLWMEEYYQRLVTAGLVDSDLATFRRWFDLMGLQRHLKAIGIFTRLHLRDGKPGYLADIPRTMAYVRQVCESYPELEEFNQFVQKYLLPVYRHFL